MNRTLRLLYLPILAIAMMAVCVPQAQAQVASVTVGEQTTTYLTLQEAFAAAASAESATLQMLQDVTLEEGKKFELESGNITLDLNGKTITGQTGSTLLRAWGDINLSILDSSTEQTGTISNHGSVLVQRGGSLAISGGTFIGANAIEIGDAQISGGRFITTATNKSAVNTDNPRLGLAMDYAYFNTASGEMLVMRDYWNRLCNSKGAIATDVTVKRATVAAVTIGEQTTTYTSSTLAFSDAVSAGQPATIKLLADVNIPEFSDISFEFTQGDVTLDLNGKAIRQGNYSAQLYSAIKVDGGKLTIIDSSASKSGKVEGRVTADGGTLVIKSGVVNGYFEAHYSANVTLYGGRFVNMDGDVIYTEFESILAEGYELFDAHSGEQVSLRVFDNLQNADVVVLPIKTAASVTIGEETTEYASFRKALAVAKVAEAATIKIHDDILVAEQLIERTLDGDREFSYFGLAFNQGDVTLDLNGHTITGQILGEKIFPEALAYLDNGGKLTLVDSSISQEGTMKCSSPISFAVCVINGPLEVYGGTYSAVENALLFNSFDYFGTLYGGRFIGENGSAIDGTFGLRLAEGYGCYDSLTGEELNFSWGSVHRPDVTVKRIEVPTAVTDVTSTAAPRAEKRIENGQVIIVVGDKKYTATGAQMK